MTAAWRASSDRCLALGGPILGPCRKSAGKAESRMPLIVTAADITSAITQVSGDASGLDSVFQSWPALDRRHQGSVDCVVQRMADVCCCEQQPRVFHIRTARYRRRGRVISDGAGWVAADGQQQMRYIATRNRFDSAGCRSEPRTAVVVEPGSCSRKVGRYRCCCSDGDSSNHQCGVGCNPGYAASN